MSQLLLPGLVPIRRYTESQDMSSRYVSRLGLRSSEARMPMTSCMLKGATITRNPIVRAYPSLYSLQVAKLRCSRVPGSARLAGACLAWWRHRSVPVLHCLLPPRVFLRGSEPAAPPSPPSSPASRRRGPRLPRCRRSPRHRLVPPRDSVWSVHHPVYTAVSTEVATHLT